MKEIQKSSRRQFLKLGGAALVALPLIGHTGLALAAKNDAVRKALAYQDSPKDGKQCSTCTNFQAPNKCTLFPGDDEIAAAGYCTGYVAKK